MKITLNLISNVFLAGIISILPYVSMIRGTIEYGNQDVWSFLPVIILPFITFIISAFGQEIADQNYKKRGKKHNTTTIYFIMLISTIIVPYVLAMLAGYINPSYIREITFVIFIILFAYTFYLFYKGSKISVLFLLPLLIHKVILFIR